MVFSSSHSIVKIPNQKNLLKYHKEILYALSNKNKEKLNTIFQGDRLFDILPLRKGLKEFIKIGEGGEIGKTKPKKGKWRSVV